MKLLSILLFAVTMLLPAAVRADNLSISPLRVDFSAQRQVVVVQLLNTGVEPLALRASAVRWPSLPNTVAPDAAPLVIQPSVTTIAPGRRQTVRIALLDRAPAAVARSFRLYFTALPNARDLTAIGPATLLTPQAAVPVVIAAAGAEAPVQWRVASEVRKPSSRKLTRAVAKRGSSAAQRRHAAASKRPVAPERRAGAATEPPPRSPPA